MTATERIRQGIISALEGRGIETNIANEYGEPGYETNKPILMANWNQLNRPECDAVERYFEIEWSDEWTTDDRGRAFRTKPDCYDWQPSQVEYQGRTVGFDELIEQNELLDWIRQDYANIRTFAVNSWAITDEMLEELGCTLLVGDQENGLHAHMNDTPEKCLEEVKPTGDWFFRIDSTSQFYITFQLWQLPDEE